MKLLPLREPKVSLRCSISQGLIPLEPTRYGSYLLFFGSVSVGLFFVLEVLLRRECRSLLSLHCHWAIQTPLGLSRSAHTIGIALDENWLHLQPWMRELNLSTNEYEAKLTSLHSQRWIKFTLDITHILLQIMSSFLSPKLALRLKECRVDVNHPTAQLFSLCITRTTQTRGNHFVLFIFCD